MKKQKEKPTVDSFIQSYAEQGGLNVVKKTTGQKRIYYLSGAITNDPHAELKFALAEEVIKREGNYAINPMRSCPAGMKWEDAIVRCLGMINQLGAFYRASLSYYGLIKGLPLAAILLIDPKGRPVESRGVKLEKGIALANGISVVQMCGDWENTLLCAISEREYEMEKEK